LDMSSGCKFEGISDALPLGAIVAN